MTEHLIERMTWQEVEARIADGVDAVLLPIGTTEQHGPHMPLDTDCLIARGLATRAAELAADEDIEVLVAPTLNVTLSWYHMQFPGSMRLSTTTFLKVFDEICDSLSHHGFENIVAINGHGGNVAALTVAVNHYFEQTGRRVFLAQWWDLAADVLTDLEGPTIHAEEAETSIAMALGQRVEMERRRVTPGIAAPQCATRASRGRHSGSTACGTRARRLSCRWTCSATSPLPAWWATRHEPASRRASAWSRSSFRASSKSAVRWQERGRNP